MPFFIVPGNLNALRNQRQKGRTVNQINIMYNKQRAVKRNFLRRVSNFV